MRLDQVQNILYKIDLNLNRIVKNLCTSYCTETIIGNGYCLAVWQDTRSYQGCLAVEGEIIWRRDWSDPIYLFFDLINTLLKINNITDGVKILPMNYGYNK